MRDVARREISLAMWRWTADGVNIETGIVKRDALKYNVRVHPASREAISTQVSGGGQELRHEHAVPRIFLAKRIIELDLDVAAIQSLLKRFCRAVIVTRSEDKDLKPRNRMPNDWKWEGGDPYARYVTSKLRDKLENVPSE
jgi:hypothetical protein